MKDYKELLESYLNGNSVKAELKTRKEVIGFLCAAKEYLTDTETRILITKMQEWF